MDQSTSQHWTYEQDTTIFPLMNCQYLKQHSPHHLENMSTSRYLLDSASTSLFSRNYDRCLKRFSPLLLLIWTTSSSSAETVEEHLSHIKQVFEKLQNVHLSMKLSNAISSLRKSITSDTSSAPQASDHYHKNQP